MNMCPGLKEEIVEFLTSDPLYQYPHEIFSSYYKELTLQRLEKIISRKFFITSGKIDIQRYLVLSDVLHMYDFSLGAKLGVQVGLFGGAIANLGTEKHHKKYLSRVYDLSLLGCFAMTEFGHGSDVRGIETTATYNKKNNTFIVNTPNDMAQKYWIGNAGKHARMAAVFAQLVIDSVSHGVHVFLVPIRWKNGEVMKNVIAMDCGHKAGLNGVDNGRLYFKNVEIPYDNLLDRFAQIENGVCASKYESPSKRFCATLVQLSGGRVVVASACTKVAQMALSVAIGYAGYRKQFGITL